MALAPDPADKGADQFQPHATSRRAGGWTTDEWIGYLHRRPDATLPSGVAKLLIERLDALEDEVAQLRADLRTFYQVEAA